MAVRTGIRKALRARPSLSTGIFAAFVATLVAATFLGGAIPGSGMAHVFAAPGPGAPPPSPGAPGTLRLSFVGDVLLASTVGHLIDAYGPMEPWLGVKDLLSSADLTCGNLECAVGTTGSPIPGKEYSFRADPKSIQGLVGSGFDVVSMANNHALDFGVDCFLEGIGAVEAAGIDVIGAGANEAEAREPFIFEHNGIRVGILATNSHYPYATWSATADRPGMATDAYKWHPEIEASIRQLSETVDIVIVVIHWGEERSTVPADKVFGIRQAMIDAGADAIIGSHPHILEGIYYDGRTVTAYSLGNFVFTARADIPACQIGAILTVTVSKDKVEAVEAVPTEIVGGRTVLLEAEKKASALATISSLSRPLGTDLDENGSVVPLLYTDMNDHWARFTIGRLAVRGSVEGYPDLSFKPEREIPKEEFAAMFVRGVASAEDIATTAEPQGFGLCAKDAWSYPYLKYLASGGIVSPTDPAWAAGNPCSRLDACVAIWKHAGSPAATSEPAFAETAGLEEQARAAISWALETRVLRGYPDGTLKLNDTVSRAEIAVILSRYLGLN